MRKDVNKRIPNRNYTQQSQQLRYIDSGERQTTLDQNPQPSRI